MQLALHCTIALSKECYDVVVPVDLYSISKQAMANSLYVRSWIFLLLLQNYLAGSALDGSIPDKFHWPATIPRIQLAMT